MKFPRPLQCAAIFVILTALFRSNAQAQDGPQADSTPSAELPQANPGRPTVSTPATLTPVGYLQVETGLLGAEKSAEFANRTAIEAVFKLSLTKRFELLAQTEPWVFSDLGARSDRNPGDIFGGLQMVIYSGGCTAVQRLTWILAATGNRLSCSLVSISGNFTSTQTPSWLNKSPMTPEYTGPSLARHSPSLIRCGESWA